METPIFHFIILLLFTTSIHMDTSRKNKKSWIEGINKGIRERCLDEKGHWKSEDVLERCKLICR